MVEEGNKEERDRACEKHLIKFLMYRASLFSKTQRYSEAISDLSAAVKISENNKYRKIAIHGFKTDIMKINLHLIQLHSVRGKYYRMSGEYRSAVGDFNHVLFLIDICDIEAKNVLRIMFSGRMLPRMILQIKLYT